MGKFCSKCGQELEAGAKFCQKCGQTVSNGQQQTQVNAVPQSQVYKSQQNVIQQLSSKVKITGVMWIIVACIQYILMQQLDASVLREFVEKIYISEVYTPDENEPRIKVREIEIVYNFIGAFDFEEAREQSQAAQKEKKTGVA